MKQLPLTQSAGALHRSPSAPALHEPSSSPVNLTHLSPSGQCLAASEQAPIRQMWPLLGMMPVLHTAPSLPLGQVSSAAQAGNA